MTASMTHNLCIIVFHFKYDFALSLICLELIIMISHLKGTGVKPGKSFSDYDIQDFVFCLVILQSTFLHEVCSIS